MAPKRLYIFIVGLLATGSAGVCEPAATQQVPRSKALERLPAVPHAELFVPPPPAPKVEGAMYWGTVKELQGAAVVLTLRDGRPLRVDMSEARERFSAATPKVGDNIVVIGSMSDGVLKA